MKQAERDLSCSSRRAFSIHKGSMGSHPSPISLGSLEEKAFSKGVVFEKESNHLSLCIIACSRNISCWAPSAPSVQIRDPACGGGCWGCSLQGASFRELTEAADTHASSLQTLSPSGHPPTFLCPTDVLGCLSSPCLSKAVPSIQEGQEARSVFQSVAQRST